MDNVDIRKTPRGWIEPAENEAIGESGLRKSGSRFSARNPL
jgi:hypothetical protein